MSWLYNPTFQKEWEEAYLYDLAEWINGNSFGSESFTGSGRPIIKISELKNGITDSTKLTDQTFKEKYLVSEGDTLFAWSGSPETSIGTYVWRREEGWLN